MADEDRTQEATQIGGQAPLPDDALETPPPSPAQAQSNSAAPPTVIYQMGPQAPMRQARVPKPPLVSRAVGPPPLDRLFPAQNESVIVYRRRPDGPPDGTYIGTYQASDLAGCVTIEQFLDKYVRPKLADGYGDYIVKLVDAGGNVRKSMLAALEPPAESAGRRSPRDSLLETAADMLRDLAQRHSTNGGISVAQIENLRRTLAGNAALGTDARVILDRLDSIARGLQPKEEHSDRALLLKLLRKIEDAMAASVPSQASTPLPPLSSAPAIDPRDIAREVAREVASAVGSNQPSLVDVIGAIQKFQPVQQPAPAQQDVVTQMTTIMTLIEKMGGGKELDRMQQKLERLEQILTHPAEQPGPLETIQQVVQVAESLEKLGERRAQRSGPGTFGSYVRDIFTGIPDVAREIGTLVDKAKQREVATTRRLLLERGQSKPARQLAEQPTQAAAKAATETVAEDPYDPSFAPYLANLVAADDDLKRIKAVLAAFRHLGHNEPWRAYYAKTVALARTGDRKAIAFVTALLDNLKKTERLSQEQRDMTVRAIEKNWDAIVDRVFRTAPQVN